MEALRRCWSHCRSNLCTAGSTERQNMGAFSCVDMSVSVCVCMYVYVPVQCLPLFIFISVPPLSVSVKTVYELVSMCPVGEYLAILGQHHGLGVAELLLDIKQSGRVMALDICTAECCHAQGIRGDCTLHALHSG